MKKLAMVTMLLALAVMAVWYAQPPRGGAIHQTALRAVNPELRIAGWRRSLDGMHLEALVYAAAIPQAPGSWMTAAGMDGLTAVALKVGSDGTLATGSDPGGQIVNCNACIVIGGLNSGVPTALKVGSDGTVATSGGSGGSVTNVATMAPLGGGPITTTGTITCTGCVTASSPGAGIAHFAGSTQAVTSSAVNLANGDVTGIVPVANGGSNQGTYTPALNICTGTIALSTSSISNDARATNTLSCTGLATSTDHAACSLVGDTNAVTGYASTAPMLTLKVYVTANTVNVDQINQTGSSLTPGAASVLCAGLR